MIEGFDKEIDALLRQTAKSNTVFAELNPKLEIQNLKIVHLDADEIAAFAENALPEKTRSACIVHFADCDRCRTILLNAILLNSEPESVPASSAAALQKVEITPLPWYRKLFDAPNLAYAMGALIILFGVFFAFIVLRNADDLQKSVEVSQISENRPVSGPSYSDETDSSAANTSSNMSFNSATSNSNAAMLNSATMSNSAVDYSSNAIAMTNTSNTAEQRTSANSAENTSTKKNEADRETASNPASSIPTAPQADATAGIAAENQSVRTRRPADSTREDNEKSKIALEAPSSSATENLPLTSRSMTELNLESSKKQNAKETESRSLGGKNFARRDKVWYDSAYNGQSTTNVRRGSEDYQRLNSGLRSIAEGLGGTIVIVWKNKAYRIQ